MALLTAARKSNLHRIKISPYEFCTLYQHDVACFGKDGPLEARRDVDHVTSLLIVQLPQISLGR
jgi:hypothetical protein